MFLEPQPQGQEIHKEKKFEKSQLPEVREFISVGAQEDKHIQDLQLFALRGEILSMDTETLSALTNALRAEISVSGLEKKVDLENLHSTLDSITKALVGEQIKRDETGKIQEPTPVGKARILAAVGREAWAKLEALKKLH